MRAEGETAFRTSFRASSNKRKDQDIVDVFRFQGKSRIFGMLMRQYQTFPARSNILYKADKAFLSISASIQARWPTPHIKTETRGLYDPVVQELLTEWGKGQSELLEKVEQGITSALRPAARRHQICSEFIGLPFVYFIRISLLQMRNMGTFLTLGFVRAWLSLNSILSRLRGC
jgi:hypothetical protein